MRMDKDILVECITLVTIVLIIALSIAIPCLISEQRNIDKEIKFRQIELYGEEIKLSNDISKGDK